MSDAPTPQLPALQPEITDRLLAWIMAYPGMNNIRVGDWIFRSVGAINTKLFNFVPVSVPDSLVLAAGPFTLIVFRDADVPDREISICRDETLVALLQLWEE